MSLRCTDRWLNGLFAVFGSTHMQAQGAQGSDYSDANRLTVRAVAANRRQTILSIIAVLIGALGGYSAAAQTPPVRDVTTPGITRVHRPNETPDLATENLRQFTGVRVENDGTLRAEGMTLKLYGVTLPPRKKICTSASGNRWTCGQRSYLMLRNLIESHAIACQIKNDDAPSDAKDASLATCRVEKVDVAISLLLNGLAELADGVTDKAYIEAASVARTQKSGLWAVSP